MNLKKIFGTALTTLGVIVLLYGAWEFLNSEQPDWKKLMVSAILGLLFFTAGIGLIKGLKDID